VAGVTHKPAAAGFVFTDLTPVTVFRELPATGDALRRQQARTS
jgi:hypothetical protein